MESSVNLNFKFEIEKSHVATLGIQERWEKFASIRSRPRRIIDPKTQNKMFYPISRQPLCIHPLIETRGEDAKIFILTQSLYKFMHDIAILETEVVNAGAIMVANNKLEYQFSEDLQQDALSVIIDEAYHAFVAKDFMYQVANFLQIPPIPLPTETEVINAYQHIKSLLPEKFHASFQLIAVCIGEHVLTKELISVSKEQNVNQTFSDVMSDHVLDEGRHAGIFREILTLYWGQLSEEAKQAIGTLLPVFLQEYLKTTIQKSFDTQILVALDIPQHEVDMIIKDTYINACMVGSNLANNPVANNLVKMLKKCSVLDHAPTNDVFVKYQLK